MLYSTGSGADIQKPLPVVAMGGLVTSTALTLLVLPALYRLTGRRPFVSDNALELLASQVMEAPPILERIAPPVPKAVSQAVARALAK